MIPAGLKAWFAKNHPGWNWDERCAGAAYQVCVATGRAVRTPVPLLRALTRHHLSPRTSGAFARQGGTA